MSRFSAKGVPGLLARLAINVLLAYVVAGAIGLVLILVGRALNPEPGAGDAVGSWGYGMLWLAMGAPLVAVVLAILDLLLRHVARQRLVATGVSLMPALLMSPVLLAGVDGVPLVLWLFLTGVVFSRLMLLPARDPESPLRPEFDPATGA